MAISDDLLVKIQIDTAQVPGALKAVTEALNKVSDQLGKTQQATEKTASAFSGIGAAAVKIHAGISLVEQGFRLVKSAAEEIFGPFKEAQDVAIRLSNTLELVGTKNVPQAVAGFQKFASALQDTSTVEDEVALRMVTLAKATGLTDGATKKLVQTAANIAAVTGEDVNSAFQSLISTYKGTARGVAVLEPQLKNLTEEQLRNGAAVDILADKYAGFAQKELQTFSGSMKQAANLVNDILEDIGKALAQGFNLGPGSQDLIKFLKDVKANMGEIQPVIAATAAAFKGLFTIIADVGIVAIEGLKSAFHGAAAGLSDMIGLLPDAAKNFLGVSDASLKAFKKGEFDSVRQSLSIIGSAAGDIKDQFTGASDAAEGLGKAAEATAKKARTIKIPKPVSEDSLKLLDEVGKKQFEIAIKLAGLGATELQQMKLKADLEKRELDLTEDRVKRNKDLSEVQRQTAVAIIENSKALISIGLAEEQRLSIQKEMLAISNDTVALGKEFMRLGFDEAELAQAALQDQLDLIDAKKEQLALDKELNAGLIAALDAQAATAKELAAEKVLQIQLGTLDPLAKAFAEGSRMIMDGITAGTNLFNSVFGTNIAKMGNETIRSLTLGAGVVADAVIKSVSMIASVTAKLFDPEFIQGLADQLSNFIDKLPDALIKAFDSLINAVGKVIDKLPQIIDKLIDGIENAIGKLLDKAPELIAKLAEGFGKFLDRLPEIFQKLFDALPGLLNKLLSTLPTLILKLFHALGSIISEAVKAFPEVMKELFDHLPDIVEAIIEGLISAMGQIAAAFVDWFVSGGAERMVGAFLRMIPKLVVAIVTGIVRGLVNAFGSIFKGVKMPDSLEKLPDKLASGVKNLAQKVTNESSQLFKVLDLQAKAHGENAAKAIQDAIDSATTRLGTQFRGLLDALKAAWKWIVDKILMPIWNALKDIWQWVYDHVLGPIITALREVWQWVWDNVLSPIITALREVWQWVWDNILGPMVTAIQAVWQWVFDNVVNPLVSGLTAIWNWVYSNIVGPIVDGLTKVWNWVYTNIIAPLLTAGASIAQGVKDVFTVDYWKSLGGHIWTGLKEAVANGIEAVKTWGANVATGFWNKIVDLWDKIASIGGKIGSGLWSKITDLWDKFSSIGSNMASGLWNKIVDLWDHFSDVGSNMATGLWNKLIGFDWGSLFGGGGGGGGGGGPASWFSTGGVLPTYAAVGKFVPRGTDTIPFMGAPGEGIVNTMGMRGIGIDGLNRINSGQPLASGPSNTEINIDISFDGLPDESFVRTRLLPQIKKELKAASLKGELLLSGRGVFGT